LETGGGNDRLMSDINVTPFVDVMLVLLIIFMVTAPMMTQGVDVNLPESKAGSLPTEEKQIVVSVNEINEVYINDYKVGLGFLKENLEKMLQNRPDRIVYLRADKKIPYGVVVKVMSEIKRAGVNNLGMVTMPPEETEASGNVSG
jgi:biopolymer transport protein TolR